MRFSWNFLLNMLKNDNSNLHTKVRVHITAKFLKYSNFKIMGLHQPHDLPSLKAYATPGGGGRFDFLFR